MRNTLMAVALAATALVTLAIPSQAEMLDDAIFTGLRIDQLEYRAGDSAGIGAWEAEAWAGDDRWKLALESEAEYAFRPDRFEVLENRVVVRRAVSEFFDARAGLRLDTPAGPDRLYGVLGIQGLAQQWFELGADLFLSDKGDVSARIEVEYDLTITNRLFLQPLVEVNLAASDDREIGQGQGLNDVEIGLRLRYEMVDRAVAPYVGVHWERKLGESAGLARNDGESTDDLRLVTGLRLLF